MSTCFPDSRGKQTFERAAKLITFAAEEMIGFAALYPSYALHRSDLSDAGHCRTAMKSTILSCLMRATTSASSSCG